MIVNPFGTDEMAAGYAAWRPAVHERVIQMVRPELGGCRALDCALDVGCGAVMSTRALMGVASRCIGLEPVEAMLRLGATILPSAQFVVGRAEALPIRDGAVDLISAAGSLNYADLDQFFPEAARVLAPRGMIVVYDFSPGRSFRDATSLDEWFAEFCRRYPPPPNEAKTLSPGILAELRSGFRVVSGREFETGITLTPEFYVNYMMTETNVAAAVRRGVHGSEIRAWCTESLTPFWNGLEREVLFRGYFACMTVD